ncbi:MAG: hypothetical protein AAFW65_01390 [Pseudomonadota bacterium]
MIRYALIVAAIGQFLVPALPSLIGFGTPVGDAARADYGGFPPEQPAGIAFAIWGVIFSFYAAFALANLFGTNETLRRVGPPLAAAGLFNVLWMLSAQTINLQLLNFVLLFPIGYFAFRAAAAFESVRGMGGAPTKLIADAATGLLSGWITVAVAISVPLTIRTLTGLGATDFPWQMLFLTLATATAGAWAFTTYVSRSLWYFGALGWGVACIALNNWFVTGMHPLALTAALAAILILRWRLTREANPVKASPLWT